MTGIIYKQLIKIITFSVLVTILTGCSGIPGQLRPCIGPFIVSIGVFVDIKEYQNLMMEMANNHSLTMTMGIFTVFLGLAIVVNHQVWKGWPIIVTLLGYWITIKGLVLLYFPQWVHHITPALIIGFILGYYGFFHHRKAK
jgi:hypothetical protein